MRTVHQTLARERDSQQFAALSHSTGPSAHLPGYVELFPGTSFHVVSPAPPLDIIIFVPYCRRPRAVCSPFLLLLWDFLLDSFLPPEGGSVADKVFLLLFILGLKNIFFPQE